MLIARVIKHEWNWGNVASGIWPFCEFALYLLTRHWQYCNNSKNFYSSYSSLTSFPLFISSGLCRSWYTPMCLPKFTVALRLSSYLAMRFGSVWILSLFQFNREIAHNLRNQTGCIIIKPNEKRKVRELELHES